MELRAETSVFDDKLLKEDIDNAQETADNAQVIAGTTAQYFWFLEEISGVPEGVGTGAHITNLTKEEFLYNPANGGGNLLARSNGIAIRDGLTELAYFSGTAAQIGKSNGYNSYFDAQSFQIRNSSTLLSKFTSNGTDIYLANDSTNSIASFGAIARIGKEASGHITVKSDGQHVWTGRESTTTNEVAFFGATARIGKIESANTGNVYIDDNSVDIRKGSTILSTFTDSGAELGKNSNTAIINMCNNAFKINGQYEQFISANDTFAVNIKNDASTSYRKVKIGAGDESYMTFFEQPNAPDRSPITNIYAGSGLIDRAVFIGLAPGPYLETDPEIILYSGQCIELYSPKVQFTQSEYSTCGAIYYAYSAPKTGSQTYNAVWTKEASGGNDYYRLGRPSSSSRRYKEDIKPVENDELDPHRLYDIPVMQFKYKEGYFPQGDEYEENRTDVVGFIAEDVLEYYPQAAIIIDEKVDNWNERYIIPPMLKLIQEQNDRITELERRLS